MRCTEHLERAHAMPWYIFDQAGTTIIRLARHLEPLRARAARQASRVCKGDALSDKKAGTSATRLTRHVVALQGPCGASFYPSGSRRCRHCPARLDLCNMPRVARRAARDTFGEQTVSGGSRQPHIQKNIMITPSQDEQPPQHHEQQHHHNEHDTISLWLL